jgi:dTDP-4-amino-4,6-dideoxygalactose transaminase
MSNLAYLFVLVIEVITFIAPRLADIPLWISLMVSILLFLGLKVWTGSNLPGQAKSLSYISPHYLPSHPPALHASPGSFFILSVGCFFPLLHNINPALIEAAITPKTKAILPVHLYGYPCDMDALMAIAKKYNLVIIEDACQAVGAAYHGKPVGSFGTGCFSLYATKNIMSGEGGMITTNDEALAQRCRMIRNHGMQRRYYHDMLGYNFRMTDLHAAIGLAQIERLAEFSEKRKANAAYLNAHITSVITPRVRSGYEHVWHQYTIRLDGGRDRDVAVKKLNDAGVGTGIFYPIPANKQAYLVAEYGNVALPMTERLGKEAISLPVHPQLSQTDLETIVNEVNKL